MEVEPFPGTRSMPGDIPGEPTVPPYQYLEYAVYDRPADTLMRYRTASSSDKENEDFGKYFYDTFKRGKYKVCFLAHSTPERSLSGNSITFGQVSDSFYASVEIDVNEKSADTAVVIAMRRVVSRVEFLATDTVPGNVFSLSVDVSGRYTAFDLFEGKAKSDPAPYLFTDTISDQERGKGVFNTHAFYTLVPSPDNKIGEITLTSSDKQKNEVYKRVVKDAPLYENRITRYKGRLYAPSSFDGGFEINIENDGDWGNPEEIALPETD
jgi:hypothetical protein